MLPVAIVLGAVVLILVTTRFERADRPYLFGSFFAHVGACIAFLWFSAAWDKYKRGDIDGYCVSASGIALLVGEDPARWGPELIKLIAHQTSDLTRLEISEVPATAAAHGWSGVAQLLSGGPDSITAGCLVVAFFSFLAKALLFSVAKSAYGAKHRPVLAIGTLFVPSVLFWTCGFVKEAYAMIGMGFAVYGLHGTFAMRRYSRLPLALFGAAMVASVKPYVLFPLVLGAAAWLFAARRGGKIRWSYVLAAAGVAYAGIALIGMVFPEFGMEAINGNIAGTRHASEMAGGGSLVGEELADDAITNPSFASNLAALPLGLVNVLVRPFLFEIRSVPQLGASLENGILWLTVILLLRKYSVKKVAQAIMNGPAIFAAVIFALTFAAAVGLSSKNLGTLSRYRVPMMPAYVLAVGVLRDRLRRMPIRLASIPKARVVLPREHGAGARPASLRRTPR